MERNPSEKNYFIHHIIYSSLISADKISASNTKVPSEKYADIDVLMREKQNIFSGKKDGISCIRNEIFENVQESLKEKWQTTSVFSITSPTGTGKTFTGFFAALKLARLLGGERKVIYSLPFTSIIEQNYEAIYRLFHAIEDFSRESSRYIIKHHSLANINYVTTEDDYTLTQSEILLENWTSGVIITTFVQLLETLIGTRNRMLKKFINFKDAVIILDEVQAIDLDYLPLVEFALRKAVQYLNLKIILMTATKPIMLNEGLELLEGNEKYFRLFDRTRIIPRLEPKTIEAFFQEFKSQLENKSYMIVCNTIAESLEIYKRIKELPAKVFYLSTNILPVHRRERIEEIKQLLQSGEKIILVSTQLVEAGVDLDFDVVIRDIGPLDSIIQCAGRCNRNGKKKVGDVYVYNLVDEKGVGYGERIYGKTSLLITKHILGNREVVWEKDYFTIANEYFEEVQRNKAQDESQKFINSLMSLNFSEETGKSKPLSKFSLIKNNPGYIDVFCVTDNDSQAVLQKYWEMMAERDFVVKREKYLQIKNRLRDYTLSVPAKYHTRFDEKMGLFILPQELSRDMYDPVTGFKRDEGESFIVF
jgi:CRISPR-associated endonuclease/helicase Cas3